MTKKIALFATGLVAAGGGFFLYTYLTGTSIFWARNKPVVSTPVVEKIKLEWESRQTNGDLEWYMTATEARPVPGQRGNYDLIEPRIENYKALKDQIIRVTAKRGRVAFLQVGGKQGKLVPKGGNLRDNVVLTVGPPKSFTAGGDKLQPGQVQARILQKAGESGELSFDFNERALRSDSSITVRGDVPGYNVAFDGKSLTLAINAEEKRVEYFRIDQGEKLVLKPLAAVATATNATPAAAENPSLLPVGPVATGPAGTPPAKKSSTFRLIFRDMVEVVQGKASLTSEQLKLMFIWQDADSGKSTTQTAAVAPATPVATGPAKPVVNDPLDFGGPGNRTEEIVLTWKGPLELRPMPAGESPLKHAKDQAAEATGSEQRPVVVSDGTRTLRAGRLWGQRSAQRLELESGALKAVEIADASMGSITCQGLKVFQAEGKLELAGPGRLESLQGGMGRTKGAAKEPGVIRWTNMLLAEIQAAPDPKNARRTTQFLRRALFTGDVDCRDTGFWMHSQKLDARLALPTEVSRQQALEHLLATGSVQIKNARPGGTLEDASAPDTIACDSLEIRTARPIETKPPQVDAMIAEGKVTAVTHQVDKSREKKLLTQMIQTPKLTVLLEPKGEKTADAGTGAFNARRLTADGGVAVELDGYGPQKIFASALTLDADPKAGTAKFTGPRPESADKMARLQQGDNLIEGSTILLAQKNQSIDIPTAGRFVFRQPAARGGESTPVQLLWQEHMKFDQKSMVGSFDGKVRATLLGKPDQKSELTCDSMQVALTGAEGDKAAIAPSAPATPGGKIRLKEIFAKGKVEAEGLTLDARGNVLTRQKLWAPSLTYFENTRTLRVPEAGKLVVEDYRPETKTPRTADARTPLGGGGSARGMTGFSWEGALVYAGDAGTIDMTKDVRMVHVPTQAFKTMPLKKGSAPRTSSRAELACQALFAKLVTTKESGDVSASPVALGTSGQVRVSQVKAQDQAVLIIDEQQLAADVVEFDTTRNFATAIGRNGNPVTIVSGELGQGTAEWARWDLTKDANAFEVRKFRLTASQ